MKHSMKKFLILTLTVITAFSAVACKHTSNITAADSDTIQTSDFSQNQIPNPWQEYATIEEATAAAGFSLTVPDNIDGYSSRVQLVMTDASDNTSSNIFEVQYITDASEDADRLSIRKAPGNEDISGVYTDYSQHTELMIDDNTVALEGQDNIFYVAKWTTNQYTYSIFTDLGMTSDALSELIRTIE